MSIITDCSKSRIADLELELRIARSQVRVFGELIEHLLPAQERLYELLRREQVNADDLRKENESLKGALQIARIDAEFEKEVANGSPRVA